MASINKQIEAARKRVQDRKWEELNRQGITKPRNEAERLRRLKEAHGGE